MTPEEAVTGELQYLFRSGSVNIVSGLGHFHVNSNEETTTNLTVAIPCVPLPFPPFCVPGTGVTTTVTSISNLDRDLNHTNLYLYSDISLPKNVTLTIGASGDFFNTDASNLPHTYNILMLEQQEY